MKAIYINLDPYLAAFAAWLKGGKVGDPPKFNPLPLAVTIPLGEEAAIYCPGNTDGDGAQFRVDGTTVIAFADGSFNPSGDGPFIATNLSPGLSVYPAYDSIGQKYAVAAVGGDSITVVVGMTDDEGENAINITFTILVRREQPSGPVDLVDYTPPAAAPSAADIKSALVAAGSGALAGVSLANTVLNTSESITSDITSDGLAPRVVSPGVSPQTIIGSVSGS